MPTYIKTGFWDEKAKAPKGWLDLNWFCATHGGGGGSQNLDQVLSVGNIGINKSIQLLGNYDVANLFPYVLEVYHSSNNVTNFKAYAEGNNSEIIRYLINGATGNTSTFQTQSDNNDKNVLLLKQNVSNNPLIERSFFVNCAFNGGNYFELLEANNNSYISKIAGTAEAGNGSGTYLEIVDDDNNNNTSARVRIRANSDGQAGQGYLEFINNNTGWIQTIAAGIGYFNQNLLNQFPTWSGDIANVNEQIRNNAVDLSTANFDCNRYGVYVVLSGSSLNNFDLTNFANNGVDGQFVTLCVQDTPIVCVNTVGAIFGAPFINIRGLYKLMKIGNDIYTSNI